MSFNDETLMAFADGELDEPTRSEVERAMRTNPALEAKVRQHIALRNDVFRAFAHVLDEPVPLRLKQVEQVAQVAQVDQMGQTAKVVQLDTVRSAMKSVVEVPRRWSWPDWGAMAATLVVGVLAGAMGLNSLRGETQLASAVGSNGTLVARGALDKALTRQLASAQPAGTAVKIGVSFASRDGRYCRSFTIGASAGLACRSGSEWEIAVLAPSSAASDGTYRQAGSAMPPAVLEAIDARAAGASLDAQGEQAAAQRGWAPANGAPSHR
jgi:hypothetical protein